MTTATYTYARDNFAEVLDTVENEQTEVIIQRRGHQDIALVPADELASLKETAHLLRSPKNAARLLAAIARSSRRQSEPTSVDELRRELGIA